MPEQHSDNEKIPVRLIGAIVAVGSLAFIGILTETVMTVLFPALMREFHVDTATIQWITTIYLLAVAATMPISSFLKRRFTLKTIFLAAVILAIIGSLIMIFAQAFPLLIVARIIQGIGSGVATPLMINIILEQSPRTKIGRLMGVLVGHHSGPGHRPDRRRRSDHRAAMACDFRHRNSAGTSRGRYRAQMHRAKDADRSGIS